MVKNVLFLIVVFVSNVIQCITGFAGTVLAMPVSIMLTGYETAKPILNVLGIAASLYILIFNIRYVNKKEFVKIISVMLIGIIGGMFFKGYVTANPSLLYKLLGIIVIVFALMNVWKFYRKKAEKELNPVVSAIILVVSGAVHGMFVCGGPLLVTYASAKLKDKNEFRATLSAVWLVLNSFIMLGDISSGYFTADVIKLMAVSLVVLIAAMVVGNLIYKKMNKNTFLILTYILMIISGVSLIVK